MMIHLKKIVHGVYKWFTTNDYYFWKRFYELME